MFKDIFKSDLEWAFPEVARREKDTSNSWSMPSMFLTKYRNLSLNISTVWRRTASKSAWPCAIRLSCSSTADLIVGRTSSGSIYNNRNIKSEIILNNSTIFLINKLLMTFSRIKQLFVPLYKMEYNDIWLVIICLDLL